MTDELPESVLSAAPSVTAIVVVVLATLGIGAYGWRFSRTTSDFFVASRSVRPAWNASAIGGEYLSAASFLGVAGLVLTFGSDMLWYPIGWTGGYLVMLTLVAAPLRRSGAYTLPDFAEARLQSLLARRVAALLVVAVGWLYLIPQFHGAGLALELVTGAPSWAGGVAVAAVVLVNVLFGGMRSITFVQAFQYWLKVTALLVPVMVLLAFWVGDGATSPAEVTAAGLSGEAWSDPSETAGQHGLYTTYSLIVATFLGTLGLPHVVVRFYTNPDGRSARRTTLVVLALLGLFYVLPPVYAALGRIYAADLVAAGRADAVVLVLPARVLDGALGTSMSALTAAGAFAAFLSTSSGLTIAVSGVLSQDFFGEGAAAGRGALASRLLRRPGPVLEGVRSFQVAALLALVVPLSVALLTPGVGVARAVGLAFAFAASTFCPLILLGIWWRRLTDVGAVTGLLVGATCAGVAILDTMAGAERVGWAAALLAQPAMWSVPAAFVTMIVVSLLTQGRVPVDVARTMARLHTPEEVRPPSPGAAPAGDPGARRSS